MASVITNSTTPDVCIQVPRVASAGFRTPLTHLLEDTREARTQYTEVAVPLYRQALKGNWKDVRPMLENDGTLMKTAITKGWATALHVAAVANRVRFVEQLVQFMEREDLELQDYNGNTAFFLAAGVGNRRLAEIMLSKNDSLPTIRGEKEVLTALHFAVIQGQSDMARFLYHSTRSTGIFQRRDWIMLFLTGINADMYDLALHMLERNQNLALVRDDNDDTGLHLLARKQLKKSFMKQTQALQLVSLLWKIILTTVDQESDIREIIRTPSPLVFDAALVGNFEFLAELLSIYPDLIWERDTQKWTIIHFAVSRRHTRIFNLIHETRIKDLIVNSVDDSGNNLLHLVAKLAPLDQLNLISGAAFQFMLELIWFEEVKKIMQPSHIELRNSEDLTPSQLFTKEHEKLREKAESWMRATANSCMLVSTVIATGVFSATFSLPGGIKDDTGIPNDLNKPGFLIFSMSNATALISSAISTLVFLSILISRYAEYDFHKGLPLKLIFGIISLFISITSMMVAFCSALDLEYEHGFKWVLFLIYILAFLLVPLFVCLQFPLLFHILKSMVLNCNCGCGYVAITVAGVVNSIRKIADIAAKKCVSAGAVTAIL